MCTGISSLFVCGKCGNNIFTSSRTTEKTIWICMECRTPHCLQMVFKFYMETLPEFDVTGIRKTVIDI